MSTDSAISKDTEMSTDLAKSTDTRAEINRENSTHSTSPRTSDGKEVASRNSTKHGLTSTKIVLSYESQEEYDDLCASMISEYEPAEGQESRTVQQIAQNYWRLQRCARIETQMFENRLGVLKMAANIDPKRNLNGDEGLSICFNEDERAFDKFRRYQTTIERSYNSSVKQLEATQKARHLREEKLRAEQEEADRQNGFVSQNPASATNQTAMQPVGDAKPTAAQIKSDQIHEMKYAAFQKRQNPIEDYLDKLMHVDFESQKNVKSDNRANDFVETDKKAA
jgi:hypothetical protein